MIGACQVTDQRFGVVLIRSGSEVGATAEPERVGCIAHMVQVDRLPDGRMSILTVGEQRFRLVGAARVMPDGYLIGSAQLNGESTGGSVPPGLVDEVAREFTRYQQATLALSGRGEVTKPSAMPTDPVQLSYRVAAAMPVPPAEQQRLLEIDDVGLRLRQELEMLKREMPRTIGPFSLN